MHITINKSGFALIDDDSKVNTIEELVPHLRSRCLIDEGLTLLDIFTAVEKSSDGVEFLRRYCRCRAIEEFHKEAKAEANKSSELSILNIEWRVEDLTDDFSLYPHVFGRGTDPDITYGLDFMSLSNVSRLPITLSSKVKIGETTYKKQFNLIDVLDAIYWEISWYGSPAKRNAMYANLLADCAEFRADLKGIDE